MLAFDTILGQLHLMNQTLAEIAVGVGRLTRHDFTLQTQRALERSPEEHRHRTS
jgi:hypothetical protein